MVLALRRSWLPSRPVWRTGPAVQIPSVLTAVLVAGGQYHRPARGPEPVGPAGVRFCLYRMGCLLLAIPSLRLVRRVRTNPARSLGTAVSRPIAGSRTALIVRTTKRLVLGGCLAPSRVVRSWDQRLPQLTVLYHVDARMCPFSRSTLRALLRSRLSCPSVRRGGGSEDAWPCRTGRAGPACGERMQSGEDKRSAAMMLRVPGGAGRPERRGRGRTATRLPGRIGGLRPAADATNGGRGGRRPLAAGGDGGSRTPVQRVPPGISYKRSRGFSSRHGGRPRQRPALASRLVFHAP